MFGRDPCKRKGCDYLYYGWSVAGFGDYRYHYKCSRCGDMTKGPAPTELEQEDESGPNTD